MSSYKFVAVEVNRGATSAPSVLDTPASNVASAFGADQTTTQPYCVSVIIDATRITGAWTNNILAINKPASKTTQGTPYNAGKSATASGSTVTLSENFNSALKKGDLMVVGTTEYTFLSDPTTTTAVVAPQPPASFTVTACYKVGITYLLDMKRINEDITIEGFLTSDYISHTDMTVKKTAEKKLEDLMYIIGNGANTVGAFNLMIRRNTIRNGKYYNCASATAGKVLCRRFNWEILPESEGAVNNGVTDTYAMKKIKITLTVTVGVDK